MTDDETPWPGTRRWTPAEATASLPLVRRISDDLGDAYRRWRQAVEAFEYASAGSPTPEAERLMADAQKLAAEVEGLLRQVCRGLSHTGTYARRGAMDSNVQVVSAMDVRS